MLSESNIPVHAMDSTKLNLLQPINSPLPLAHKHVGLMGHIIH